MSFHEISEAEADRFLRHVRRTDEVRLAELARHVVAGGGPIDMLDGSIDSLLPLWSWFSAEVEAGLPSIPDDATPDVSVFFGEERFPAARVQYAAQGLAHYLLRVVRVRHPDAEWGLFPHKKRRARSASNNATGIVFGPEGWYPVFLTTGNLSSWRFDGERFELDALRTNYFRNTGEQAGPDGGRPSGTFRLADYASHPLPSWSELRQAIPRHRGQSAASRELDCVSVELQLAPAVADAPPKASAGALDHRAVIRALSRLGAVSVSSGEPVGDELVDGGDYVVGEDVLLVTAIASGGELRVVTFETAVASAAQWAEIETELRRLAQETGAVLSAEQ